ncbi:hypothetical protein GW17_00012865 [Ensete ventricosum]|nr:hypothetical protein GW17_00012865 [Ensete ventricosum]
MTVNSTPDEHTTRNLDRKLSQKTPVFGLRLWVVIGICVGVLIVFILSILSIWVTSKRKTKRNFDNLPISQIPNVSKEITVDRVGNHCFAQTFPEREGPFFLSHDNYSDMDSRKTLAHLTLNKSSDADNMSQSSSVYHNDRAGSSYSGDEGSSGPTRKAYTGHALVSASPLIGLPESSHLGWGHWFTLRDLELATSRFSKENVLGEGGYGVVYRGRLINGSEVAVKKLLNNLGYMELCANMVNLVEWLKMMVGNRRAEEVVDPNLEVKPATRALKRTLLVALRCVDPDADKRPKMGQVVRMLEADEVSYREVIQIPCHIILLKL